MKGLSLGRSEETEVVYHGAPRTGAQRLCQGRGRHCEILDARVVRIPQR